MELKEFLEKLDITVGEDATEEQILEAVRGKYIARDLATEDDEIAGKVFGRQAGTYETILKRNLKALGMSEDELKDFNLKKFKENEDKYFASIAETHKTTVEELKRAAAQGNDKKVEELTKKLEGLEEKNVSLSTMLQEKEQALEEKEKNYKGEIKKFKINQLLEKKRSKYALSDSVDEYKKKGFEVTFNEKYIVDLNDDETDLAIYDRERKPVPNDKKSGFAGFDEVYERELKEGNMLKVNNAKEQQPTPPKSAGSEQSQGFIRSAGHAEMLRKAASNG